MSAASSINTENYWRAVLDRDRRFDGMFVFGVRSTRVYCRPSCPARRPKRKNVAFYASWHEAERAGLRACRRCKPERPRDAMSEKVLQACKLIDRNVDRRLTLAELAGELGASPNHLQRAFKRVIGITPHEYLLQRRIELFKRQMKNGLPVASAVYEAGFGSSSRVYERSSASLGMTPATYRKGGAGMQIAYTIEDSPLNRLLVAVTERGICAISLGDDDASLVEGLEREYPRADIRRDDRRLKSWVQRVLGRIENHSTAELPLDVSGTAFQRQVWSALQEIPYGSTRSYEDVAVAMKRPRAARAVARACATNRVAIVIPCHRVVTRKGEPGGYKWGPERKRALLETERRGDD